MNHDSHQFRKVHGTGITLIHAFDLQKIINEIGAENDLIQLSEPFF
jgi:hypothetical protein